MAFKYVGVLDITCEERQTEYLCVVEEVLYISRWCNANSRIKISDRGADGCVTST